MTEREKQECAKAVVVGLARNLFPTDGDMLHLLGQLTTAKSANFEVALKAVCEYGEKHQRGFAVLAKRGIEVALKEIENARKLTPKR